jgi:hypothetical protein
LIAKLYPLDKPSTTEVPLTVVSGTHALMFTGILTSSPPDPEEAPSFVGLIQVWVDEPYDEDNPRRETVTDYVVGGNPARIWSRGARIWSRGARIWSSGARIWSRGTPVSSADGQVGIYDPNPAYDDEWFLTVQASTVTPHPWMTLVGKAYQVSARAPKSHTVPDLTDMSIAFSYLGSDVPPGEEQWLAIYHWNGEGWDKLDIQWLGTLPELAFGKSYWISLAQSTTLRLRGGSGQGMEKNPDRPYLPAIYFGTVSGTSDFRPTAGMSVLATIDGHPCGGSLAKEIGGEIIYAISVLPEGPGVAAGCGIVGRQVTFQVGSTAMIPSVAWNDDHVREVDLYPFPIGNRRLWLPTIRRH